jgi:hypothetical protein
MPARRTTSIRPLLLVTRPLRAGGHDAPDVRRRFGAAQRLDPAPVAFIGLEGVQHPVGADPAGESASAAMRGGVGRSLAKTRRFRVAWARSREVPRADGLRTRFDSRRLHLYLKGQPLSVGLYSCGILRACGGSWGFLPTSRVGLEDRSDPGFPLSGWLLDCRSAAIGRSPVPAKLRLTEQELTRGRIERLVGIILTRGKLQPRGISLAGLLLRGLAG